MTIKISDKDPSATLWHSKTAVHRVFAGGWQAVHDACAGGCRVPLAGLLIPPIWSEMRADPVTNVLYDDAVALYSARVQRTILTNFYALTAAFMTGQVFGGRSEMELPSRLEYLNADCDGHGTGVMQFFAGQFFAALVSGVRGCVVTTNKPPGAGATLAADDEAAGWRVLLADVAGESILGGQQGRVRIHSVVDEPEPEPGWGSVQVNYVHVASSAGLEVWKKRPDDGEYSKVGEIPYPAGAAPAGFFIPGGKIGQYHGLPVLDDLAGVQLQHLHLTALDAQAMATCNTMIPHAHGYDLGGKISGSAATFQSGRWTESTVSGQKIWTDYEGQHAPFIKIAEPSGAVLGINKTRLDSILHNAALWGMSMLRPDGISVSTATSWEIISSSSLSTLATWAQAMEQYIQRRIEVAAKLHDVPLAGPVVSLEKDYSKVDFGQLANYLKAVDQGVISKRTAFDTLNKEGGIETGGRTFDEEQEQINEEALAENQTVDLTGVENAGSTLPPVDSLAGGV